MGRARALGGSGQPGGHLLQRVCEVGQQDAGRHLEAGVGPRSPLMVGYGRWSLVEGCVVTV